MRLQENILKIYGTLCCIVLNKYHIFALPITVYVKVAVLKEFFTKCNIYKQAAS